MIARSDAVKAADLGIRRAPDRHAYRSGGIAAIIADD
jgi:hypothetical protein